MIMGILDGMKDKIGEHSDKIEQGIEKAGDFVDSKTGDKYKDKVDQAQQFAKDQVDKLGGKGEQGKQQA